MPIHADAPLRKVTLNLYDSDCAAMEKRYGRGWSEKVRQLVHEHIHRKRMTEGFVKHTEIFDE